MSEGLQQHLGEGHLICPTCPFAGCADCEHQGGCRK